MTTPPSAGLPTSYLELAEVLSNLRLLVREARRTRQVTQQDAAKEAGMSPATWCRFEKGKDVSLDNAIALLRWLGGVPSEAAPKPTMSVAPGKPKESIRYIPVAVGGRGPA